MSGFFEQLGEKCDGLTLKISVSIKNHLITCSVVPMLDNKIIKPVTVSEASGKELDEKFVTELTNGLAAHKASIIGLDEMEKSLAEAKKKASEKAKPKDSKPEKKVEEKKEEVKKVEHQPGFF